MAPQPWLTPRATSQEHTAQPPLNSYKLMHNCCRYRYNSMILGYSRSKPMLPPEAKLQLGPTRFCPTTSLPRPAGRPLKRRLDPTHPRPRRERSHSSGLVDQYRPWPTPPNPRWADLLAMSGRFSWPPAGNFAGRLREDAHGRSQWYNAIAEPIQPQG